MTRSAYAEEHLLLINLSGFGISLLSAMEEGGALGARFDADFEGEVAGERLSGASVGTLYLFPSGGPTVMVRRYGEVLTADHARIAVTGEGYGRYYSAEERLSFSESTTFYSAHPAYSFLNGPALVGVGALNLAEGTIEITTTTSQGPVLHTPSFV